ncbi:MAG: 4Fe-4S dicluster domain-containing protein, partial [Candidatus Thorarchaeota archaeon]
IAKVDFSKCTGCKICASRCDFGALSFNDGMSVPFINAWQCFGCGLCATACPENAIEMVDRNENPLLKDVW